MLRIRRRVWRGLVLLAAAYLLLVAVASAATVHSNPSLALQSKQVWTLVIGALVPLATYVLNYLGPWASEKVKAAVLVIVAAIAGGLYTALATSSFGFNSATLQMVITSVIAALAAHHTLWKPAGISTALGGGRNAGSWRLSRVQPPPAAAPPAA